ncbi:MAG: hypothetical protein IJG84_26210 [Kiritimatiellae bacterium]|nr:hypothetical protein [Kiritimatiellia bacterium]
MDRLPGVFIFAAVLASSAAAFDCSQIFREERFSRGDVNRRVLQPADEADWIWIDDAGPSGKDIDAVRFEADFLSSGETLVIDVSADERFVLFLDGREIARGPHKGAVNHWYYETYEVSDLEPGTHRMEAVAYRMGDAAPRAVLTSGVGGFLVKASGTYDPILTTATRSGARRLPAADTRLTAEMPFCYISREKHLLRRKGKTWNPWHPEMQVRPQDGSSSAARSAPGRFSRRAQEARPAPTRRPTACGSLSPACARKAGAYGFSRPRRSSPALRSPSCATWTPAQWTSRPRKSSGGPASGRARRRTCARSWKTRR